MNALLAILALVLSIAVLFFMPLVLPPAFTAFYGDFTFFDSARALVLCAVIAIFISLILHRAGSDGPFLVRLFVAALLLRILIAAVIFSTNTQQFFGGDAFTFDTLGISLIKGWNGSIYDANRVLQFTGKGYSGSGWGMVYLIAAIYSLIGRNMFAVQLFNSVLGAVTAPIIFSVAQTLFGHRQVSRTAAVGVALFPSLVLWSAQGLKDGPIVFLLALVMLATLKLAEKFSLPFFAVLVASLFGILTLRFYVFYMAVAAVFLAFVIGSRALSAQNIVRQLVVVIGLGVAFSYLGVSRFANAQLEQYGSLEKAQNARENMVVSAESGYGKDFDISTADGVVTALPTGMVYLLFAPFPWQMGSLRSLITLPEMALWWSCFPLLVLGVWYSLRYKTRKCAPILVFIAMLTVAYAVFQGNIGTAYRQRSQLLVFYLIFVSVGYFLYKERREDRKVAKVK
jgi:4-amino-4-deoxy-L-arabinose transferase-like glycosyltransferase